MNDAPALAPPFAVTGHLFEYGFGTDGALASEADKAAWTWRAYALTDMRARRAIDKDDALPQAVRELLTGTNERPQFRVHDGWIFGVLPDEGHRHYSGNETSARLRFACDATRLITARRQPLQCVDDMRERIESGAERCAKPFDFVCAITDILVSHKVAAVRAMGDQLDSIEDRIVSDSWHGERERLAPLRRRIVAVQREIAALAAALHHHDIRAGDPALAEAAEALARLAPRADMLHHDGEQLMARARLLQEELMARIGEESNRLLYMISVLTAVLMPTTIVTGLFGMNLQGIPFASRPWGFAIAAGLSATGAVAILALVRRLARTR